MEDENINLQNEQASVAAPQTRARMGGWGSDAPLQSASQKPTSVMTEGVSSLDSSVGDTTSPNPLNQPTFGRRKPQQQQDMKSRFDDDVITDITEIPDLDDNAPSQDDITAQVAQAPNVRISGRVQNLQELDDELGFGGGMMSVMDGIDLSLLTSILLSQDKVEEPDQAWDYDSLFIEIMNELQPEANDDEKEEGDENDSRYNPTDRDLEKRIPAAPLRQRGPPAAVSS